MKLVLLDPLDELVRLESVVSRLLGGHLNVMLLQEKPVLLVETDEMVLPVIKVHPVRLVL